MDNKILPYLIVSIFAVIILYYMATTMQAIAEPTVNLENITFVLNNTNYNLGSSPTNSDLTLYYFDNTTFPLPAGKYLASTTQVKVYANGTGSYPNITNGSTTFYYATYTYQTSGTVFGIDFNFMGLLVFLGIGVWIAYKITKDK